MDEPVRVDRARQVFQLLMVAWTLWVAWCGTQFLQTRFTAMRVYAVMLIWAPVMLVLAVLMPATRWLIRQWRQP